jgi:hypothetical protein
MKKVARLIGRPSKGKWKGGGGIILPVTLGPGPVIDLLAADDDGVSDSDNITSITNPGFEVDITGTDAAIGDDLVTYIDGVEAGREVIVDPDGILASGLAPLAIGTYVITMKVDTVMSGLSEASNPINLEIVAPAPTYTGPGDIAGAPTHFWALYAVDAAYADGTNPCVDLVDQAGANEETFNIATDGIVDVAAIEAWVTANTVTTIRVKRIYDQMGVEDMLNTVLGNMMELQLNASGTIPSFKSDGARNIATFNAITIAQPYTVSGVVKRTGTPAAFHVAYAFNGTLSMMYWPDTQFVIDAGNLVAAPGVATSENVFLSMGLLVNGASSKGAIDGTVGGTFNPGSNNANGTGIIFSGMEGQAFGWGVWTGDVSADLPAIHANDATVLGI